MQNTTEFHLKEMLMTWRALLPGNLSEAVPTSACSGMPIFMRSYFTLSPNLSTTLTLPADEHPAWRVAGSGSDSWLDANFRGRDEMCFLDGTPVLTSRNTDGWPPCCARARSPAESDDLVCADSKHPSKACPLLAPVQWQKLNHGPHRTQLLRSFGKTMIHDSQSLTPPSCLSAKASRMTHCQRKSTETSMWLPRTTGLRAWNCDMWTWFPLARGTSGPSQFICSPCPLGTGVSKMLILMFYFIN